MKVYDNREETLVSVLELFTFPNAQKERKTKTVGAMKLSADSVPEAALQTALYSISK